MEKARVCTVRTRAQSSTLVEGTMAEKQCAHLPRTCFAEAGKEFCSDECRTARTEGTACVAPKTIQGLVEML